VGRKSEAAALLGVVVAAARPAPATTLAVEELDDELEELRVEDSVGMAVDELELESDSDVAPLLLLLLEPELDVLLAESSLPSPHGTAGDGFSGWLASGGGTVSPSAEAIVQRVVHCGLAPSASVNW
jgi:hypothetical protein